VKRLLLVVLLLAVLSAGCSSSSNTLSLKGDIQNNILSSISTVPGKIIQMNKQQGEPVKKGEIIAVIDNTNQKFAVDQLQAVVNMKKAKLQELQQGTRPQQLAQAQAQVNAAKAQLEQLSSGSGAAQIEQVKGAVAIFQGNVNAAQLTYDYLSTQYDNALTAYNAGKLSESDLAAAKYKLDTASAQLASLKDQLGISQRQLSDQITAANKGVAAARANYDAANAQLSLLQTGATTQAITAAQADLDQSTAQLNQARNALDNCSITALADGIIISKNFQLGDVVTVGSNLADIAVANDLYVLAYIPDEYLGKIQYGQSLSVKTADGDKTGKVSYIALKHEYTPKDKQSVSDSKHTSTKINVAITDASGTLKSGMTATVKVPLK